MEIGAAHAINYSAQDFVEEVKRLTDGEGVAVVLDMVGGDYVQRNLQCLADEGRLRGGGVVATVMSNLGLERYLAGKGLELVRTAVGDRYVLERMRAGGYNLGGEQSGHMILADHATTGDGTIAALQVLAALVSSGKPGFEPPVGLFRVHKKYATVTMSGAEGMMPYGVTRLLGGLVFSLGLVLVVVGGAQLFTGDALMVMAWASGRVTARRMLRVWTIVWIGNFAGAAGTAVLVFLSG